MRILIEPADPLEWRRSGTVTPRCTADACCQGRKPCPCPNDCEQADTEPLTARESLKFWAWVLVPPLCILAAAFVIVAH